MAAAPFRPGFFADGEQEFEVFGEQGLVVVEAVAEQREGFDERAAPGHDLRPPAGEAIERGELLVDPHRIVGRQHRHRAREADALRARRPRRQRHRGGRDGVVGPVVLAEAEDVEPDLIGELDFFQKVGEGLVEIDRLAGRGRRAGSRQRCRRRTP